VKFGKQSGKKIEIFDKEIETIRKNQNPIKNTITE
jgi:hypothetical protein